MARIDVMAVLEDGLNRATRRNGLMIIGALFLIQLASRFTGAAVAPQRISPITSPAALLELNVHLLAVIGIVTQILSVYVLIVALRVFVSEERQVIPDVHMRRNMWHALLQTVIGQIVLFILILIGLLLFIVPGIYLITTLLFWSVFIAVEDRDFITAFRASWELTGGHRWQVFGLLAGILIAFLGIGVVDGVVMAASGSVVAGIISPLLSAAGTTFAAAVVARAYVTLQAE